MLNNRIVYTPAQPRPKPLVGLAAVGVFALYLTLVFSLIDLVVYHG